MGFGCSLVANFLMSAIKSGDSKTGSSPRARSFMFRNWLEELRRRMNQRRCARRAGRGSSKVGRDFERLEERETPSAVNWMGGATGYWDVAANWSGNAVPALTADVSISTATAATITIR